MKWSALAWYTECFDCLFVAVTFVGLCCRLHCGRWLAAVLDYCRTRSYVVTCFTCGYLAGDVKPTRFSMNARGCGPRGGRMPLFAQNVERDAALLHHRQQRPPLRMAHCNKRRAGQTFLLCSPSLLRLLWFAFGAAFFVVRIERVGRG